MDVVRKDDELGSREVDGARCIEASSGDRDDETRCDGWLVDASAMKRRLGQLTDASFWGPSRAGGRSQMATRTLISRMTVMMTYGKPMLSRLVAVADLTRWIYFGGRGGREQKKGTLEVNQQSIQGQSQFSAKKERERPK